MKFQVTFKTPDALDEGVEAALTSWYSRLKAEAEAIESLESFTGEDLECVKDRVREKMLDSASKWIEWGEYITIELDTEADTCKVIRSSS